MQQSNSHANLIMVAAIDFGTTFSGYAFSLKAKPKEVNMNKNWGEQMGHKSYKAPTCVLTGPDGEFVSFGYSAEKDYCSMTKDNAAGYDLFRNFKMMLHGKKISLSSTIKSTTEKERPAIEIFKMALVYLKEHLIQALKDAQIRLEINTTDLIRWVITVPAIWTDEAKHFMREASFRAGLIENIVSDQLVIALEPEAASVYCHSLSADNLMGLDERMAFKSEDVYMVIDAGGGTVDIAVHKIIDSTDVKEIYPPSGGPWGGTCVDEAYKCLLMEIFSEDFIQLFMKNQPLAWLDMMIYFDKIKASLMPKSDSVNDNGLNIQLTYIFGKEFAKHSKGQFIEDIIEEKSTDLGVTFENGFLQISHEKALQLFQDPVNKIVSHLKSMKTDQIFEQLKYVMVVGGFGQCKILQNEIFHLFEKQTIVVIPNEGQLAIIKGAVLFGQQPDSISSRISRCSYGFDIMKPFEEGVHDPRHKLESEGKIWCTSIFKPVVKRGDEVQVGTTVEHLMGINNEGKYNGFTELSLYCSEERDVKYIYDEGVKKLCTLTIKHENCTSLMKRYSICVMTTFGGTELWVRAKVHGTGEAEEWAETSILFSSHKKYR